MFGMKIHKIREGYIMDNNIALIILCITISILYLKCSAQASNQDYYKYKKNMNEFYILEKSSIFCQLMDPTSMFVVFFFIPILIKIFVFVLEIELNIIIIELSIMIALILLFITIALEFINQTNEFYSQKILADKGDNLSQITVGAMYENGIGTCKNYQRAAEYYEKSALQGNAVAMYLLGCLYEFGKNGNQGIAKNSEKGFELIQESARRGYKEAQRHIKYVKGRIFPFNRS